MALHATRSLAAIAGLASPAGAEDCRLALVLALDVSESVDSFEDRFQREGLAQALVAPEVVRAFLAGEPVALYVFQWAGEDFQVMLVPDWQMIRSEKDLARIATVIAATEKSQFGYRHPPTATAVGTALSFAAEALNRAPACQARTVDIAGDGTNNQGVEPRDIYSSDRLDGVTVNALVVGTGRDTGAPPGAEAELVTWFQTEVLHGPGAFWILADGYEDYERAMTAKLLRELEMPLVSGWAVAGNGA